MDNLVYNCTDALLAPNIPLCATDYGERIVAFAVMKTDGTFTVAGSDNPTAAEFQSAITAGTLTYYSGVTNGHKIAGSMTELSGDDTVTGGVERYDEMDKFEGRLKLIDETVSRATEQLNRKSQVRLWLFTDKHYCFGGKTGYLSSINAGTKKFEGKGNPPYIPVDAEWLITGPDNAKYDADYASLT